MCIIYTNCIQFKRLTNPIFSTTFFCSWLNPTTTFESLPGVILVGNLLNLDRYYVSTLLGTFWPFTILLSYIKTFSTISTFTFFTLASGFFIFIFFEGLGCPRKNFHFELCSLLNDYETESILNGDGPTFILIGDGHVFIFLFFPFYLATHQNQMTLAWGICIAKIMNVST